MKCSFVAKLVNDDLVFHEVVVALAVVLGRHGGDEMRLASLYQAFDLGFELLAQIVVLQVVDDADVVDVLAVRRDEFVPGVVRNAPLRRRLARLLVRKNSLPLPSFLTWLVIRVDRRIQHLLHKLFCLVHFGLLIH